MSSTDRQNRLLLAEDWKKIYQTYRNADFESYDFENLRRVMINYLRTNYPEDFNDYIESSEYLALVDIIAFLGQSVAFRVDLNARENFLELAERRDSILRLSTLISYNAKRNIAATGLLKFATIQTTESVLDSNGRNLANQVVTWNDTSNPNWYDQFINVMNAGFSSNQQFGNPSDKATIQSIPSEQYRFQAANTDIPVYSFTKLVAGRTMGFEVTSATFSGQNYVYEEPPKIGNSLACVYRNDGRGTSSPTTGFFFNFTQGSLNTGTFTISQPSTTESVDISSSGINNTDVWLYRLDSNGLEADLWTPVPDFEGNNIIYNSLAKSIRNIYSIASRVGDAISLNFSDGTFGNLPVGTFRTYYRVSNGLSYTINPSDIRSIIVAIPYVSITGQLETLTITLNLASSVSNSDSAETNASIKANAPANYYTQNRMITGEDYNISPLSVNQQVMKVKSVNRTSSGISRYFDLLDPTGAYSSTNLFADDGVLYFEKYTTKSKFSYITKIDIQGIIYNTVFEILARVPLRNFYYDNFNNYELTSLSITWETITTDSNMVSGYVKSINVAPVGNLNTATNLKYLSVGSMVKFSAPVGYYFDTNANNKLIYVGNPSNGQVQSLWATVVSVIADGTAAGIGTLSNGSGPIVLDTVISSGAILSQIIPQWRTVIDSPVITTMIDLIYSNRPFGLRYDVSTQTWKLIFETNLDTASNFNLSNQGLTNNSQQDSSWFLLFTTDNEFYTITSRELRYIFESDRQVRFYTDVIDKVYDSTTNRVVSDIINILSINPIPGDMVTPYTIDNKWTVSDVCIGLDGYIDNSRIMISFSPSGSSGLIADPETFVNIVGTTTDAIRYIIQQKYTVSTGQEDYRYVDNSNSLVLFYPDQLAIEALSLYPIGQYFYFINTDVVLQLLPNYDLQPSLDYQVYIGRDKLKFQYTHSATYASRIDPGSSNIIDIYVLTKLYDNTYRQWISGATIDEPLPPSSAELYDSLSPSLNLIKSISDEVIYHPVSYKVLFGALAAPELQASFQIIKTVGQVISDNDVKSQVIRAINQFFALENWDFGDTFYFTELATYVTTQLAPNISSIVIVPNQSSLHFGSLFEITSFGYELFINGATVNDVTIVTSITSSNINSTSGIQTPTSVTSQQAITSTPYGSI